MHLVPGTKGEPNGRNMENAMSQAFEKKVKKRK